VLTARYELDINIQCRLNSKSLRPAVSIPGFSVYRIQANSDLVRWLKVTS